MKSGEPANPIHAYGEPLHDVPTEPSDPLLKVCALLNKHGAKYIIAGGHACILHGLVRTTEDVDLLVQDDSENFQRVIDALAELEDGAARELVPQDIKDNVVVKVADEVEVDISRQAWKVSYEEAVKSVNYLELEGIKIPYLSLPDLIASKETYREKDQLDLVYLKKLLRDQRPG